MADDRCSTPQPGSVRKAGEWLSGRSSWQVFLLGLAAAAAIEAVTCLFRFGLGLEATRDTAAAGALTFGFRVHHGYFGVLFLALAACSPWKSIRTLLLVAGLGLAVSDLVHHFVVLNLAVGDPEFHIRYPG
ncbi:MAG: hypothetical protein MUC63_05960 [Planctomycetes bacterium]|nr:hypothetical protein [Planctomycetota bacterium]